MLQKPGKRGLKGLFLLTGRNIIKEAGFPEMPQAL
jgi:hypothetical protein